MSNGIAHVLSQNRIIEALSSLRASWLYRHLKEPAQAIKVFLQMGVGIAGSVAVLVAVSRDTLNGNSALYSSKHALLIISVSLAVAASLELAYTLFTPGPDEAVDPLLLGISAVFLYLASGLDSLTWTGGVSVILFAVTLGILFAVRRRFIDDDDVREGQRRRRAAREGELQTMTDSDASNILLDLLEIAEFAWHDRYQELGPPEEVIKQVLQSSPGQLGKAVVLLKARLEDE